MSKEALFRGKCVFTGVWRHGFYYTSKGNSIIRDANGSESIVIPETVGQSIESCDKNGIIIFEGNNLKIQLPLGGFWGNVKQEKIGLVRFEPDYGAFIVEWEYSKNQHHVILDCDIAYESEIIDAELY